MDEEGNEQRPDQRLRERREHLVDQPADDRERHQDEGARVEVAFGDLHRLPILDATHAE
jgi:hypothetical protein